MQHTLHTLFPACYQLGGQFAEGRLFRGPICRGPTFLGGQFAEGRFGKGPIRPAPLYGSLIFRSPCFSHCRYLVISWFQTVSTELVAVEVNFFCTKVALLWAEGDSIVSSSSEYFLQYLIVLFFCLCTNQDVIPLVSTKG